MSALVLLSQCDVLCVWCRKSDNGQLNSRSHSCDTIRVIGRFACNQKCLRNRVKSEDLGDLVHNFWLFMPITFHSVFS